MRVITAIADQNLIDFVLQYTGSTEGLFSILELNEGLGVNSTIQRGDLITIPDEPTDVNIVNYYLKNNTIVITGEKILDGDFPLPNANWILNSATINRNLKAFKSSSSMS